jgi:tripartite-type tricarboxylate transporter receptor subunit TctC
MGGMRTGFAAVAVALLVLAAPASAQDYPNRQVRLVVPFPPGGINDIVARVISQHLGERLGKQVIVDNRGGAGGVVGAEIVANAPKDGHTLLTVSLATAVLALHAALRSAEILRADLHVGRSAENQPVCGHSGRGAVA